MPDGTTQTAPGLLGPFGLGGVVTTPYGAPTAAGPTMGQPHPGVDIGGLPIGTAIPAFVGGTVTKVYRDAIGGNQVEVTTPEGFKQIYAHLIAVHVTPGQTVTGGDTVGFLGNTGTVTGPHLHYEVRQPGGGTIDPQLFLSEFLGGGGPVRSPAGQSTDQCSMLPQSARDSIKGFISGAGLVPGSDAAAQIKGQYPDVPVACLQQLAYELAGQVANPKGWQDALGTVLGWAGNGQNWTKLGLSVVGAGLIVGGVVLYTRPSAAAAVMRAV